MGEINMKKSMLALALAQVMCVSVKGFQVNDRVTSWYFLGGKVHCKDERGTIINVVNDGIVDIRFDDGGTQKNMDVTRYNVILLNSPKYSPSGMKSAERMLEKLHEPDAFDIEDRKGKQGDKPRRKYSPPPIKKRSAKPIDIPSIKIPEF